MASWPEQGGSQAHSSSQCSQPTGSKLIFSFGHLPPCAQIEILLRLFGRRGVKAIFNTSGVRTEYYYVLMPSKKSEASSIKSGT